MKTSTLNTGFLWCVQRARRKIESEIFYEMYLYTNTGICAACWKSNAIAQLQLRFPFFFSVERRILCVTNESHSLSASNTVCCAFVCCYFFFVFIVVCYFSFLWIFVRMCVSEQISTYKLNREILELKAVTVHFKMMFRFIYSVNAIALNVKTIAMQLQHETRARLHRGWESSASLSHLTSVQRMQCLKKSEWKYIAFIMNAPLIFFFSKIKK